MSQITFPTEAAFLEALEGVSCCPTIKWSELENERIYGITRVRSVRTKFGERSIGRLVLPPLDGWERDVWLPKRLAADISDMSLPVFVRPMGLAMVDGEPDREYQRYQLHQPTKPAKQEL